MKVTVLSLLTAVLVVLCQTKSASAQAIAASATAEQAHPLACDRLALTPEQRKRHFNELGPALRARKTSVRELADGFEFQFPADSTTFQLLTEWVVGERVCCPFFEIALRSEPQGGPVWLRLTGKSGVKEFIETEGAAWLK